ncbi:ADP-ribosylglycohydrolase family protein [Salinifilum aidingensis]
MMTPEAPSQNAVKARGLLLGVAVGDALGAAFEGQLRVDAEHLAEYERGTAQLHYTDDTALTLVLARHLTKRRGLLPVDEDVLASELAREYQREPGRGYGRGLRETFERILTGQSWEQAAKASFAGQGSYGNGAAMRVAPIALVAASPAHAAGLARRSAAVTHIHPDGQHGTVLQACAALLALNSDPRKPLDRYAFLSHLARALECADWRSRLGAVYDLLGDTAPAAAAEHLGNDARARTSVPLALLAFLQHPDHPAEAIRYAVLAGGDTDTTAAMAAALSAGRTGVHALPTEWIDRLEDASEIGELADVLAARMPLSQ